MGIWVLNLFRVALILSFVFHFLDALFQIEDLLFELGCDFIECKYEERHHERNAQFHQKKIGRAHV